MTGKKIYLKLITGRFRYMIRALCILNLLICSSCVYGQGNYDHIFLRADSLCKLQQCVEALSCLNVIDRRELEVADDTTKLLYNIVLGESYISIDAERAIEPLDKAIEIYERLRLKCPRYIESLYYRAFVCDMLNDRSAAEQYYKRALLKGSVVEHNVDIDNNCYLNLGNIYNERGDYELASQCYKNVNLRDSNQVTEIHGGYYGKSLDMYTELCKANRWEEALVFNDSLIDYSKVKYGEQHPFYLLALWNKCIILSTGLQSDADAILTYKYMIELSDKYKIRDNSIAEAYLKYVELSCRLHRIDDAMSIFSEAIKYFEQNNSSDYPLCDLYLSPGMEYVNIGNYETGIALIEKWLDNVGSTQNAYAIPYAINKLTFAYVMKKDEKKCLDMLLPIITSYKSGECKVNQSLVAIYAQTVGLAYYSMEFYQNAIEYFELSEKIKKSVGEMSDANNIEYIGLCKIKLRK